MPSGSHASGGSHFGGSFSGGGSHFSGHHSSSSSTTTSHVVVGGPRVIMFGGRHVYLSERRAKFSDVLILLALVAGLIALICGIGWGSTAADLRTIKADYEHYQKMIAYAEAHENYTLLARVTDYQRYEHSTKYYCVFYEFDTADGKVCYGNSYYVYSFEEAKALLEQGVVLALDVASEHTTNLSDSVPLDYKDSILTDDVEYIAKKGELRGMRVGFAISLTICLACIVGFLVAHFTAKQATDEQIAAQQAKTNTTDTNNQGNWTCPYCHSVNTAQRTTCEACGARRN